MAPSFGRSISFPLSPARSHKAARHVRSISLPCRCSSHPLLAHLQSQIGAVRAWIQNLSSVPAGLAHLDELHAALAELLLLPEARSALQNGSATADHLLDGFLALADAHGAFQETALELKAQASEAQAALRRTDAARLASAVRAQRKAEKELARLAASVRGAARWPVPCAATSSAAEIEVAGVLAEAVSAVAEASAVVFSAVESMSALATALAASFSKKASKVSFVKKSKASEQAKEILALERLEEVEGCIAEMEGASDKVFRSILHARVALLNIHTETCC